MIWSQLPQGNSCGFNLRCKCACTFTHVTSESIASTLAVYIEIYIYPSYSILWCVSYDAHEMYRGDLAKLYLCGVLARLLKPPDGCMVLICRHDRQVPGYHLRFSSFCRVVEFLNRLFVSHKSLWDFLTRKGRMIHWVGSRIWDRMM